MTKLVGRRTERARSRYFKIVKYQAITVVVLAVIVSAFNGVAAYSIVLGGLVYLVPTAYTAWKHFGNQADDSAQATLAKMYAGQIWKMALMGTGFALIFTQVENLSVFSLFATLILLQLIQLVMQFGVKENS